MALTSRERCWWRPARSPNSTRHESPDRSGLRGWAQWIAAVGVLVFTGIGLCAIGYGGYALWVQHSGTSAQVKLDHCKKNGRRSGDFRTCTAVWQPSGETPRTVTVHGRRISTRQTVNVRIRGNGAFTGSYNSWPIIAVGIVMVALWPVTWLISRRRKRYNPA
ncbi:hypothetical protein [Mycobacterium camsae]|uniref:hypothetical protein n=1 Tax=Mycobacterium gordonae TaxID=1778 RepID=UPI00197EFAD4|nr:hypothetical protein [Mycobacterium gordonae]